MLIVDFLARVHSSIVAMIRSVLDEIQRTLERRPELTSLIEKRNETKDLIDDCKLT